MTHRTLLEPVEPIDISKSIIVTGLAKIEPLEAAELQLLKLDEDISSGYLYLSPSPRKALRDKYLILTVENARLKAENERMITAIASIVIDEWYEYRSFDHFVDFWNGDSDE